MADVLEVLTREGDSIVDSAGTALARSGLRHYEEAGEGWHGGSAPGSDRCGLQDR